MPRRLPSQAIFNRFQNYSLWSLRLFSSISHATPSSPWTTQLSCVFKDGQNLRLGRNYLIMSVHFFPQLTPPPLQPSSYFRETARLRFQCDEFGRWEWDVSSTRSARVGCESWVETERVRGGGNFSKREDEGGRGGG